MGLREDAEAARLRTIAEADQAKLDEEERKRRRENQRRADVEESAWSVALEVLGIDDFTESVWVEEPPISEGYPPNFHLQLRTEDGVWLRYAQHGCHTMRNRVLHRWMVMQRCPVDDHWVGHSSWTETLSGLGEQLLAAPATMKKHLQQNHPEAIAA